VEFNLRYLTPWHLGSTVFEEILLVSVAANVCVELVPSAKCVEDGRFSCAIRTRKNNQSRSSRYSTYREVRESTEMCGTKGFQMHWIARYLLELGKSQIKAREEASANSLCSSTQAAPEVGRSLAE
jgi:hypothetical protein